jgi:hypothetical protein
MEMFAAGAQRRLVAAVAAGCALMIGASSPAAAWFQSWQTPPSEFDHPYPAEHLLIYRTADPDENCGKLWERSNGRVEARSCTIAPQNDPGALKIRLAFIADHEEFGQRWAADPELCVIVLPEVGFFGVEEEVSDKLFKFEQPHCWGWREHAPAVAAVQTDVKVANANP